MIIDTDAGLDDFLAIAYLLTRPEIRIEAFTLVNGVSDVDEGANAILLIQEKAGISPRIPVYKGAARPDNQFPAEWRHSASQLIDRLKWGRPSIPPQSISAEQFLAERLTPRRPPADILAIGPLTTLASVFRRTPAASRRVRKMVIMGGSIGPEGAQMGNIPPKLFAEGNIFVDPLAAEIVFSAGMKPTLVPLNATSQAIIDMGFVKAFRSTTPLGRIAGEVLRMIAADSLGPGQPPYHAWDPLAAMYCVVPPVLNNIVPLRLTVVRTGDHAGETRIAAGEPNVLAAMGADGVAFRDHYLTAFEN
ncbi:MAG: nucleoside hydrolase [Bryobacteraceae bacterium]|nr:nucleoside hydrolase [Bryobacteraceae bacterium]